MVLLSGDASMSATTGSFPPHLQTIFFSNLPDDRSQTFTMFSLEDKMNFPSGENKTLVTVFACPVGIMSSGVCAITTLAIILKVNRKQGEPDKYALTKSFIEFLRRTADSERYLIQKYEECMETGILDLSMKAEDLDSSEEKDIFLD